MKTVARFVLLLSATLIAIAQPSTSPGPSNLIRDNALVIADANIRIPAPGPDWHWEILHTSKPMPADAFGSFVCHNPQTNEYYLVTLPGGKATHTSDAFIDGSLASIRDSSPEAANSLRYEKVGYPVPGTLRYRFSSTHPTAGLHQTFAYAMVTGTTVMMMTMTKANEEPAGFTTFVKSLQLLKPIPAEKPADIDSSSSMPGYFFVLALAAGIAAWINKKKQRRIAGPFKVAAWAVAIVFGADLAFALYLINTKHIDDPYWQTRLVGGVVAGAIIPLIVAIVLAVFDGRKAEVTASS